VKNVQTLLAPKKPGAIDKDSAKEKPPKQNKRSHSDVANESVEESPLFSEHDDVNFLYMIQQKTALKSQNLQS
jgi:hypothetical protein